MAKQRRMSPARAVERAVDYVNVWDLFDHSRSVMKEALVERDDEIDMVLTALLCGENPLLVGPPGTGKSFLLDSLMRWMDLDPEEKFDYLLNKYTDPMEIFGPIDVLALKSGDNKRNVDGYLPTAHVAFLDEIFKGSSAILNTLLKVLNERRFRYGKQQLDCPLVLCVAASNE